MLEKMQLLMKYTAKAPAEVAALARDLNNMVTQTALYCRALVQIRSSWFPTSKGKA